MIMSRSLTAVLLLVLTLAGNQTFAQEKEPAGPFCLAGMALETNGADFVVESLKRLYHGRTESDEGLNDLLCLDQLQYESAQRRLNEGESREVLDNRLRDRALRLMAARDVDRDGILDFRIKEYGTFVENDPDADNDGIGNLMDPRPLSADADRDAIASNDGDKDGLPDHLDWSTWNELLPVEVRKPEELVRLQQRIFERYNFVLLETEGSEFSLALADIVNDVLRLFASMLKNVPAPETPRSISVAAKYDVNPLNVMAEVSPATDQMIIYTDVVGDFETDPRQKLSLFLLLVHEFTHVIQNAMDYPDNKQGLLEFNTHFKPKKFAARLADLGWKLKDRVSEGIRRVGSFVDHEKEPIAMEENLADISLVSLRDMCSNRWDNYNDTLWRKQHVINCYSLTSAREWHAEYLTAAVLSRMYDRLDKKWSDDAPGYIARAQVKLCEASGEDSYDYENANPKHIKNLQRDLRLYWWRTDRLVKKYIVEPFSDTPVCDKPGTNCCYYGTGE